MELEQRVDSETRSVEVEYVRGSVNNVYFKQSPRGELEERRMQIGEIDDTTYSARRELVPGELGFVVGDKSSNHDVRTYANFGYATRRREGGDNFFSLTLDEEGRLVISRADWYGRSVATVSYRKPNWDSFGDVRGNKEMFVSPGDEIRVRTIDYTRNIGHGNGDGIVEGSGQPLREYEHLFKIKSLKKKEK